MENFEMFKTIPIFISSSFKDMHEERDYLNSFIFPKLDSWLTKWGWRLQIMDLRGTTAEPTNNLEEAILKMCLLGVEYCKPYFIGLIGDRYGWIPTGKNSEEAIQNICKEFKDIEYKELIGKSATHMEIYYAMKFLEKNKCFFYFRNMKSNISKEYKDGDKKQAQLKEDIREIIIKEAPNNLKKYDVIDINDRNKDLSILGELIFKDLKKSILLELEHISDLSLNLTSQIQFYFKKKYENSVPMKDIDYIKNFINTSKEYNVMMVTGKEGCGKSTLAARCVYDFQNMDALVIPYCGGVGPNTFQIEDMLDYIKLVLKNYGKKQKIDMKVNIQDTIKYEYDHFDNLLYAISKHKKVVIIIDGLGNMEQTRENFEFLWIDPKLLDRVKIIAFVPERNFFMSWKHKILTLDYSKDETFLRAVLEVSAARKFKRFDKDILELAYKKVEKVGTPLYARIITDYLMGMTASNYRMNEKEDSYLKWMEEAIKVMPTDLIQSYNLVINRVVEAFGNLSLEILYLIAISDIGLREVDLQYAIKYLKNQLNIKNNTNKEYQLSDDALLLSLRGFLSDHLNPFSFNGFWQFEHNSIKKLINQKLKDEDKLQITANALVKSMEKLSSSDIFKKQGFIYYCFKANVTLPLLPLLEDSSIIMNENIWDSAIENIIGTYLDDGIKWLLSILKAIGEQKNKENIYSKFFMNFFAIKSWSVKMAFPAQKILPIIKYGCEIIELLPKTKSNLLLLQYAYREYLETCIILHCDNLNDDVIEKLINLGEYLVKEMKEDTLDISNKEKAYIWDMLAFGYVNKASKEILVDVVEPYNKNMKKALKFINLYRENRKDFCYYKEYHKLLAIYANALENNSFFTGIKEYEKIIDINRFIYKSIYATFREHNIEMDMTIANIDTLVFADARLGNSFLSTGNASLSIKYYEKIIKIYEVYLNQVSISAKIISEYGDRLLEYGEALILNGDIKDSIEVFEKGLNYYRPLVRNNPKPYVIIIMLRILKHLYVFSNLGMGKKEKYLSEIRELNQYGFIDSLGYNPFNIIASHPMEKIKEWRKTKSLTGRIPALGTIDVLKDMSNLWGILWESNQLEEFIDEIDLQVYEIWIQDRLLKIRSNKDTQNEIHWYLSGLNALIAKIEIMMDRNSKKEYIEIIKKQYKYLKLLIAKDIIEKKSFIGYVFAKFGYFFMNNNEMKLAEESWQFVIIETDNRREFGFEVINEFKRGRGLTNLAIIEEDYENVEKALEYYQQALNGLEKILKIHTLDKVNEEMAFIYYSITKILYYEDFYEKDEDILYLADQAIILISSTGYLEDEKKLDLLYDILVFALEIYAYNKKWDKVSEVINFIDEIIKPLEEKEILDFDYQKEFEKLVKVAMFSLPENGELVSREFIDDIKNLIDLINE